MNKHVILVEEVFFTFVAGIFGHPERVRFTFVVDLKLYPDMFVTETFAPLTPVAGIMPVTLGAVVDRTVRFVPADVVFEPPALAMVRRAVYMPGFG